MKRTLGALLVIALFLLSGCTGMIYRNPLSEAEAEEMTLDALADLSATLDDLERRNGVNRIDMSVEDPEGMSGSLEVRFTWGEGDVVRADFDAEIDTSDLVGGMALDEAEHGNGTGNETDPDGDQTGGNGTDDGNQTDDADGGDPPAGDGASDDGMGMFGDMPATFSLQVTIYCAPDRVVEVFNGQASERRTSDECLPSEDAPGDEMEVAPIDDLTIKAIEVDRWEVDAVLVGEDGEESTIHVDQRGRITEGTITDPDGAVVTLTVSYGPRFAMEVPETDTRVPVDIELEEEEIDPSSYVGRRYTITGADVEAPLSELELRINEGWGPDAEQVAAWAMDSTVLDSQSNLTFAFHDADEDAHLSEGDLFTVSADEGAIFLGYDVFVFDTWAGLREGESPVEMPGVATPLLLLGLLGLVVAIVRRR